MMAVLMLLRFGRSISLNKHVIFFRLYVHIFLYCLSQKIEKIQVNPISGFSNLFPKSHLYFQGMCIKISDTS